MTMADGTKEDLVAVAKQEILSKFQAAVLDNPEFSGMEFSALLRAAREGDDDDFIEILLQVFSAQNGETMEETIRRIVSELQEEDDEKVCHCTPASNEIGKGIAILGIGIVAAASLFAPIDSTLRLGIVIGAAVLSIFI